jgi:hypothetical protein
LLKSTFSRWFVILIAVFALIAPGSISIAGTTGTLSGTVVDSTTKLPISGVKVTAASPSQISSQTTDGEGHYSFLSLAPDTYTVSAEGKGFEPDSETGITVVADNTRILPIALGKALKTIGRTISRANSGSLVRPGTTADVYSINAETQAKVAAAGGGGNLDSAFSALSTVPGVAVLPGQSGYIGAAAALSIRGGDYDQIGYQIDGIPVNRAFDNYPSGSTSSLGQQELQVYTGAPPASSVSEGISGYINQVIKTGTIPGFQSLTFGVGAPAYYHKFAAEFGGETANRRFSYYAGIGGYNQTYHYADNFDGASIGTSYGVPYGVACDPTVSAKVAPSCYNGSAFNNGLLLGPNNLFLTSQVADRDTVVNLHYYVPHKDGSRDDLQALSSINFINTKIYSSTNDQGGAAFLNTVGIGAPTYLDGYKLNLQPGTLASAGTLNSSAGYYYFPNTPTHAFGAPIPENDQDGTNNNQGIVKLQYTKSLGTNAFARLYGYTYYSNWLIYGAQSAQFNGNAGNPGDYELSSHSRGLNFAFTDQLNAKNLLQFGADYVTSNVLRSNNTQYINGSYSASKLRSRTAVGVLVDSSNPTNGICYTSAATPTPCYKSAANYNGAAQFATIRSAFDGTVKAVPNATCGSGPCQYLVLENGTYATFNQVDPRFYGLSLTDEFRPTSKLTINGGLRVDIYQYQSADTTGTTARTFLYNAYDRDNCLNSSTQAITNKVYGLGLASSDAACPTGYVAAPFTNPSGKTTQTYDVFQPRLGFTYAIDPSTVIRGSYGRYGQPPNSAFEQYNVAQQNAPAQLYGVYGFQQYGFYSPSHPIPPAASNNYDFSIEHQFPQQISIKLTPFLRQTQNQTQQFFLNRATNFVSGLNVGNQTSRGVELELDKGDFARDGLSARLAFAYTNSYIKYNTLSNGRTVLSPVVDGINAYNAFTKAGGGASCYTTAAGDGTPGTADPTCAAGSIANPYYNAPLQSTSAYAPGSRFVPYDTIPAAIGVSSTQIGVPFVASLVLNEKIKRFSIAPIFQLFAGQRYGTPLSTAGIDPTACTGALNTTTAGDPRYANGPQPGASFDASKCGQLDNGIPNIETGSFDGIGAYVNPTNLLMHMQLSYEVSKNFAITANVSNLINTCFGGSSVPWNIAGACGYTYSNGGNQGALGNTYNPGDGTQKQAIGKSAYAPIFSQQPLGIAVNATLKL